MCETPITDTLFMIGCGHMGGAIARGLLAQDSPPAIHVIKPSPLPADLHGRAAYSPSIQDAQDALRSAKICLLAIKPQKMREICPDLAQSLPTDCLVISVAAGTTLAGIGQYFAADQPVIRAMPNTPSAIRKGISILCANTAASPAQKDSAETIMAACGKTGWIDDEGLMDAVTGTSGSGPAYLFYFIEALSHAAQESGLPKDLADDLARQTVIGAAALVESAPETSPATLRENVTSPYGTTQAGLDVLMKGEFADILKRAVGAARKRGQELSQD